MGLIDQVKSANDKKVIAGAQPENQPKPENNQIVQGGPLDPAAPEAQPPEPVAPAIVTPSPAEPLYRGLTGDIKTPEELVQYTKNLEALYAQKAAVPAPANPVTPQPAPTNPQDARTRFAETIFAKPEDAADIILQEVDRRDNERKQQAATVQQFWQSFYTNNPDLKRMENIVESVRVANAARIQSMTSPVEIEKFISTETRKIVDQVKRESGIKETVLPPGQAHNLRGSGEIPPAPAAAPAQPLNFTDQIRRLKPGARK